MAHQKEAEVKSLNLRLTTSEQHAELIKMYSSPLVSQSPLVVNSRTVSKIASSVNLPSHPVPRINLSESPPRERHMMNVLSPKGTPPRERHTVTNDSPLKTSPSNDDDDSLTGSDSNITIEAIIDDEVMLKVYTNLINHTH